MMEDNLSPDHVPTIDWTIVDDLRLLQEEGEPDFVEEMVNLFAEHTPPLLTAIQQAIAAADPAGLRRAAHTLKGNSNSIGAMRMMALSLALEKIGKAETTTGAETIFAELIDEFEKASQALQERTA